MNSFNNEENKKEDNLNKNITPVLFKNKTFSRCKNKSKFTSTPPIVDEPITAENVKQHIQQEIENENNTKDIIQESYKAVEKQRSSKKRWLSFGFLMLNLVIMVGIFVYQFMHEEPVSFADLLSSKMNWWWLLIGVVLFLIINLLDSCRIMICMKKATGRTRPFLSLKSTITCRFYDNMTPLATGGQPFQIYYLNKRGINGSTASSVPLAKYIFSQLSYVIITSIVLLTSSLLNLEINITLITLAWIGLLANIFIIAAVFFMSISKKAAPKMLIGILKLGNKMHLVKDYKATYRKLYRTVREYSKTFKMFMKNGWIALLQFGVTLIQVIAAYSVPFVVYCMFNPFDLSVWFELAVLQVICDLALCFIPIPGGAGGAELSFAALFAPYFASTQGIFVWAMLFWRIFTYYGYLIQGAFLLLYDFAIGNKKIKPLIEKYEEEDRQRNLNMTAVNNPNDKTILITSKKDTKTRRKK